MTGCLNQSSPLLNIVFPTVVQHRFTLVKQSVNTQTESVCEMHQTISMAGLVEFGVLTLLSWYQLPVMKRMVLF